MSESLPQDPLRHFHHVIPLHETLSLSWEEASHKAPFLPRGWYELSRLGVDDRLDFTREYWLATLPFEGSQGSILEERLEDFFDLMEEVSIFLTQTTPEALFDVHMVYALVGGVGFFQGSPPASGEALHSFKSRFEPIRFPADYLAFLRIHDGFSKYTDRGLIPSRELASVYQKLQQALAGDLLVRPDGAAIDPASLIPFYESHQLHCFQCFYEEWYPESEMGNLYFSMSSHKISNFLGGVDERLEGSFSSFLGWLIRYLEEE